MNNNLPAGITGENDLVLFERYLKNDTDGYSAVLKNCLESHRGKLIKAESLIAGKLCERVGVLLEVGADYIVIRPRKDCVSTIIALKDIKYITVIHDNDRRKTGLR